MTRIQAHEPQSSRRTEHAALSMRGLEYGYETGAPVVSDVSASLVAGRLCCLIGPNASGKTTLLRLMLGQLDPWAGEVWLGGERVHDLSPRRRARRMSYVPQRGGVAFAFTVREVVRMGRFARGADEAAVSAALTACDLTNVADRPYTHLSGGQQQRVLIARAIAQSQCGGRVMLLDEPGSSLDLWHLHRLMALLREQASQGLAVLVVLHDLNLAARYADDVWLMAEGRLCAAGEWDSVMHPDVLEPVYRVGLQPLHAENSNRPVFHVDPSSKL